MADKLLWLLGHEYSQTQKDSTLIIKIADLF